MVQIMARLVAPRRGVPYARQSGTRADPASGKPEQAATASAARDSRRLSPVQWLRSKNESPKVVELLRRARRALPGDPSSVTRCPRPETAVPAPPHAQRVESSATVVRHPGRSAWARCSCGRR
ncbi:hypothetical protein I553_6719 [Mycobacterium xenopi 4042]|uniref:Uncharacterized protein n=1 Tax=Mycobacterium xenopi 4042 TaxID=1299334 RepID=X8DC23_MYCXE|nr:hypothetical protein I553_6719 [Mycobacterium xenopi 4042]